MSTASPRCSAAPEPAGDPGSTGTRYFATDHSGMIRQASDLPLGDITEGIPLQ